MHITYHICPPCPLKQPVAVHVMIHIASGEALIDGLGAVRVEGIDVIQYTVLPTLSCVRSPLWTDRHRAKRVLDLRVLA